MSSTGFTRRARSWQAAVVVAVFLPAAAYAQSAPERYSSEDKARIEQELNDIKSARQDLDAKIAALEAKLNGTASNPTAPDQVPIAPTPSAAVAQAGEATTDPYDPPKGDGIGARRAG